VFDERGRVLVMQRRDYGHWEPPGEVLKVGEAVEQGLKREVEEETRLKVNVGPLVGVYENPAHGVLSLVFHCTPEGGAPATSDEAMEVQWVTVEEAYRILNRDYSDWVADALNEGSPTVPLQEAIIKGASSSPHSGG
jgi:8-oxo-dGTP diphosphatase